MSSPLPPRPQLPLTVTFPVRLRNWDSIPKDLFPQAIIAVLRGLITGNVGREYNATLCFWRDRHKRFRSPVPDEKLRLDVDEAFENLTYAFEDYIPQLRTFREVEHLMVMLMTLNTVAEYATVRFSNG